jgi:hybrid cluster-associated redox disulfide protein
MAMPSDTFDDLDVAEIMRRWPATIRVFLDRNMSCVGCPIAPFHTLVDAAAEHHLLLPELQAALERQRRARL